MKEEMKPPLVKGKIILWMFLKKLEPESLADSSSTVETCGKKAEKMKTENGRNLRM